MGNLPVPPPPPQQYPNGARRPSPSAPSSPRRKMLDDLVTHFTVKLDDVKQHRWWTLVTPAFSHVQTYHILGNLFAFSTFSRMLLAYGIGPVRYAVLILGSAVSGNAAFLYQAAQRQQTQQWQRQRRQPQETRALGLSGVVMGLGAAVSLATPRFKVLLFGVVPVPVWLLMALYTVYDSARLDDQASTTGHAAHLGGAAFGVLYYVAALRAQAGLPFAWVFRR
ncbi:hypothetical protein AYO21_00647 [Fonsecaea monophora]|uniref:Peptidase S54 rhomboid domain-containing protein n=1 Tax=Fonsecaea monophora TaxID=254056 RepID=A0A177FQ79_9EURO|nr:hypothetical protein AYO21_00647 [Fonsecaea monophora]KAH0840697.1 hypothetical protein FOPE_06000 [Fonsecaea pedrosoi]OAG45299.1 hypothetical protein AYO21_00647 [Fonsecaea monophora]